MKPRRFDKAVNFSMSVVSAAMSAPRTCWVKGRKGGIVQRPSTRDNTSRPEEKVLASALLRQPKVRKNGKALAFQAAAQLLLKCGSFLGAWNAPPPASGPLADRLAGIHDARDVKRL